MVRECSVCGKLLYAYQDPCYECLEKKVAALIVKADPDVDALIKERDAYRQTAMLAERACPLCQENCVIRIRLREAEKCYPRFTRRTESPSKDVGGDGT